MSTSIVSQLFWKDIDLMRKPVIAYWIGGFLAVAIAIIGEETSGLIAFILFVSALGATGIHAVMATVVEERREQTLPFILSLPVTIRDYTTAKIAANLSIFMSVWITLSAAALFISFWGDGGQPDGMLPFVCILLLAILVAYALILAVAMVTESLGWAIGATVVGNIGTQMLLWVIADLYGIRSTMGGPESVWNSTAITVIAIQLLLIVGFIATTYYMQSRKTDFL